MARHYGNQKEILTLTYNSYMSLPTKFAYDFSESTDDPVLTDTTLDNFNAHAKASHLINFAMEELESQANKNNIYILWGGYYNFGNNQLQFAQIEKIM